MQTSEALDWLAECKLEQERRIVQLALGIAQRDGCLEVNYRIESRKQIEESQKKIEALEVALATLKP